MSQVCHWCFTCYDVDAFVVPMYHNAFKYCVYQEEVCPDTGRIHLQGYIEFSRSMRRKAVQIACGVPTMNCRARRGTRKQARDYCMKEDSRVDNEVPMEFGSWVEGAPSGSKQGAATHLANAREIIKTKETVDDLYRDPRLDLVTARFPNWCEKVLALNEPPLEVDIDLYQWQQDMITILDAPPINRRIYWIWSQASGTGKSTFFSYCSSKYRVLPCDGRMSDLVHIYDKHQILWFDFTRASVGFESYKCLEKFSNHGYITSTKYGGRVKLFRSHVVVTSNISPDVSKLPGDRLRVINVDPPRAQPMLRLDMGMLLASRVPDE